MRVSDRQRFWLTNYNIDQAKKENLESLRILSSQKKINALRDDPIGMSHGVVYQEGLEKIQDYKKNIDYSMGFVEISESAISGITESLSRVHELSVAMSSDTYGEDSRRASSKEIEELTNHIIQLANTKYNGRYVFSGFQTDIPALSQDGSYLGDDGAIFLEIDENAFRKVNLSGRELFEATDEEKQKGHFDLISALKGLTDSLNSNNKFGIHRMMDEIAYHSDRAGSFQASIGSIWQSLESTSKRLELKSEQQIKYISDIKDADIYDATSRFKKAETSLQSTLMASEKFLHPSLLNYLK